MNLTNKTIVITGGNSGIGEAIVKLLSDKNRLIVCGRNIATLERLKSSMPAIDILKCDITVSEDIENLVKKLETDYGKIDILFNNAAVFKELDFEQLNFPTEEFEDEIATNFTAQVKLTYKLLPILRKSEDAAIVNITSGFGLVPAKRAPVYSATKGAMHSFTQSLRFQLKPISIKIFEAILPLVDTPSTKNNSNKKISAQEAASQILSGLAKNKNEIYVGEVKWLPLLLRVAPSYTARMMSEM